MDRNGKTLIAYDKNSIAYSNKFMEFPPYLERIKEFIGILNPGMKVLDVGCGPGNVSRQLMLSGKKFVIKGIDFSNEMIKLARENVPNGEFICQDIREICFQEESFDVIILSFCIVHLTDAETVVLLQKASKHLKQQGKLYLSFMEGKKEGFEITSFSTDEIYFCYHSTDRVEEILKDNGFSLIKVKKQNYPEENGTVTTDVFIFAEKD